MRDYNLMIANKVKRSNQSDEITDKRQTID